MLLNASFASLLRHNVAINPPNNPPNVLGPFSVFATSRLVRLLFGGAENLQEKFRRSGLKLDELQAHVELRGPTIREALDPDDLARIGHGLYVREKELHLQQLAHLELVVAIDPNAAEADIDGLPLARKKRHARRAAIERHTESPVLSAILRGAVERGHRVQPYKSAFTWDLGARAKRPRRLRFMPRRNPRERDGAGPSRLELHAQWFLRRLHFVSSRAYALVNGWSSGRTVGFSRPSTCCSISGTLCSARPTR